MAVGDKQAEKLRALAQQHVDDEVVCAAIFLRKGETASRAIQGFARGAGLHQWASSMERAPDFPSQTLIAVTAGAMHCFEAKGGFSWKVKAPLGTWAHGSYRAESGEGTITRFLTLSFFDGTRAELETQVSGAQRFQARAVDELVARSGAPLGDGQGDGQGDDATDVGPG